MKINRAILLLTTVLIAAHGAGLLSTFHNLSHHAQPTLAQSCHSEQTTQKQAPNAPTDRQDDRQDDQQDDKDCDLCLTLHSTITTLSEPTLLPTIQPAHQFQSVRDTHRAPKLLLLTDLAARAPPVLSSHST